jgi:hypothetical protein
MMSIGPDTFESIQIELRTLRTKVRSLDTPLIQLEADFFKETADLTKTRDELSGLLRELPEGGLDLFLGEQKSQLQLLVDEKVLKAQMLSQQLDLMRKHLPILKEAKRTLKQKLAGSIRSAPQAPLAVTHTAVAHNPAVAHDPAAAHNPAVAHDPAAAHNPAAALVLMHPQAPPYIQPKHVAVQGESERQQSLRSRERNETPEEMRTIAKRLRVRESPEKR